VEVAKHLNMPNAELGLLMVTTSQFYRVNGEGIQHRGVTPDVVLPSVDAIRGRAASDANANFGFDRVPGIAVPTQDMVTTDMVLRLRARTHDRRQASAEFRTLQTRIEWEQGQNARAIETLKEQEYRDKIMAAPTVQLPTSKPGEVDYYLREVFAIAVDYTGAIGNKTAVPSAIVKAPPAPDPALLRRQELNNQRESARQSIIALEEEIRILNNKMTAALGAMALAKLAYDRAPAGSADEFLAELAFIAARAAYEDLKADLGRAEAALKAARSRYQRLLDER
jgi:hypothetical protein